MAPVGLEGAPSGPGAAHRCDISSPCSFAWSENIAEPAATKLESNGEDIGAPLRLAVTVSTRNTAGYRDPAVIAIDQMKEIYIDAMLEPVETANWFPKVIRKDYTIGVNVSETAVDDPDQMLYENYACGSDRNYTGYCDKEVDALIDRQSGEHNAEKRRELVWGIERRLARDASRPIIFYTRAATCWRPRVKGLNLVVNSVFNSWRFEDVWLDR
jgi:peptide/nickel transport system substrate-binding protein